ncbi:uncharacterized protein LOC100899674 [Galendromus occidentalis]|uniref:Uncharacterized protein LOC100899674 n=1 Tax=Galendromus occidentalis TaxID=34638 RepID=A0AAJ7PBB7_9ACAR|nr:uncharacterized protein LOC100899674 [Galendromus occidentalis]
MFSSWEIRSIKEALPILNVISLTNFEALCNIVISRMNGESTPSTEKHFGDSLKLTLTELSVALQGLQSILSACTLQLTKPLILLQKLRECGFSAEHSEKLASIWALHAQQLVNRARGSQVTQGIRLSLSGWEIHANVANPQPVVSLSLRIGEENKVLDMDRAQLENLFDQIQQIQKEVDALLTAD